jgi:hypothetical protein
MKMVYKKKRKLDVEEEVKEYEGKKVRMSDGESKR